MKFQGEECVLNMASYFNRSDVLLNGTLWVRSSADASIRYQHPWLHFTHLLPTADNANLRTWLRAVAAGRPVEPLNLTGSVQQLHVLDTSNTNEISLGVHYTQSPEPIWWAWDITSPLQIRIDIPRNEFVHLITVFDPVEWSFF